MKLIFCLDDGCGIAFNCRRQSRDPVLTRDVLSLIGTDRLFASEYTAKLFPDGCCTVCENGRDVDADAWYFSELLSPSEYVEISDTVVIYRWNRMYPSDVKFEGSLEAFGFKLCESVDFVGLAHEKITREIYKRV